MLKIQFNQFPELNTDRLLLREMTDADADRLYQFRSDPRVMEYFGRPVMESIDEARQFIVKIHEMFTSHEGVQWAICLSGNPEMIGTITIWKIDKTNHRGEIGYLLDPEQQRKGIMSEALQAILQYGFKTLKLHSMEANVNPDNQKSINLLERNGFVKEAHFRENFYNDGVFEDSAIYSLIDPG